MNSKYQKRKKIFELIIGSPEHQVSRREIRDNLEHTYPNNGEKYVDAIIGRLLASGTLARIKPGLYRPGSGSRRVKECTDPAQLSILDALQPQESPIPEPARYCHPCTTGAQIFTFKQSAAV